MYRFQNDYNEIAHPAVMKAITDTVGQRYSSLFFIAYYLTIHS